MTYETMAHFNADSATIRLLKSQLTDGSHVWAVGLAEDGQSAILDMVSESWADRVFNAMRDGAA